MINELSGQFAAKATESLSGAAREFEAGAYNNTVNRCYYAAYQAAVSILIEAGMVAHKSLEKLTHQNVRSRFAKDIVQRRKLIPLVDPSAIYELATIRDQADYMPAPVGEKKAARALKLSRMIVGGVVTYMEKRS